ncbi:unnamed protein product, partial [marine sediment metagenome]
MAGGFNIMSLRGKVKWYILGWATCLIIACAIIDIPDSKPTLCDYK